MKGMILIEVDNSKTKMGNFRLQEVVEKHLWKLVDEHKDNYTLVLTPNIQPREYSKYVKYVMGDNGEKICLLLSRVPLSPYKQDT